MGLVLVLSIVIRVLALGWSLLLLRRTRDWRMGFLALMIALMTTRQGLSLTSLVPSGSFWLEGGGMELPGLAMSGMVLLAVVFLGRMLADLARPEERLAASEAHYRVLAQQARDMIFVIDPEGNYTYVSPASERMVGMMPEEMIGSNAIERSQDPEIARTERSLLARASAGDLDEITFESELRHVDGRVTPTEVSGSAIRVEDGRLIGVQGAARDITERHRAEAALQESERKYRDVVETTHELIVRTDIEGVVEFVNPALTRTLGYEPSDVLGRPIFDFLAAENVEDDRETFQDSVDTGELVSFYETVALHKSGARVNLSVTVRPVFDEKGTGVVGSTLTVADITERRMAEDAQRESEERYRTLLDNVPLAVAAIDRRGRLVAANPQLARLIGAPSVEAIVDRVDALEGPILRGVGLTDVTRRCMDQAESGTVDAEWRTNWG
ncbi:MAG: PAS domain S-box protein [bacterium]|nr:PAS domain S-box protein [bacterium]